MGWRKGGKAAVKRTKMRKTCAEADDHGEKRTKMGKTCAEAADSGGKRTKTGKTCAEADDSGEKRTKTGKTCAEAADSGGKRTKMGKTCARQEETKKELRTQLLEKSFRQKRPRTFSHLVIRSIVIQLFAFDAGEMSGKLTAIRSVAHGHFRLP